MQHYWIEFLTLAIVHFLAVVAPGPDLAVTISQSIRYGRASGVWTALGIGAGISVHVIYTIAGVGLILAHSENLFLLVKIAGAAYLLYLAYSMVQAKPAPVNEIDVRTAIGEQTPFASFKKGFLTNALNPKATLFFVAIFTTIVSASTPPAVQIFYGVWMCVVNAAWFAFVAVVLSVDSVRKTFLSYGYWFDRTMGVLFILLALKLMLSVAH